MNFSTQQHNHYCGIDLPARALYLCIRDPSGTIVGHKHLPTPPAACWRVTAPSRADLGVAGDCLCPW